MIFQENFVVIIECGVCIEFAIIDPKIESHVIEVFFCPVVLLQLGGRKAVHQPVYGIVFFDTLVDKAGVVCGNGCGAERAASCVFQDVNVVRRIEDSVSKQNRAKRFRLALDFLWLAKVKLWKIVVVWSGAYLILLRAACQGAHS